MDMDMNKLRAAVDSANEEAKQAIEDGTLVPEPETEETTTEHVGIVGPTSTEPNETQDEYTQKQKYRNDVLSFMGLSYVSLSARRKSIRDNMEALRANKQYLDELRKAAADMSDESAAEIAAMNLNAHADFFHNYDGLMSEGVMLTKMIDMITERFPDEKKRSVLFVSNSMVQSCQNQIASLKMHNEDGSHNGDIKRLMNIIAAYANRQDASPIMNKLSYGHNVLNHIKMLRDMDPKKVIEDINTYFYEVFKDKDMVKFRALLTRLRLETMTSTGEVDKDRATELSMVAALFITHWLGYSYMQEKENGRSTYFKTFIMNVYDYYSSDMIFDLPGGRQVFKMTTQLIFACFETAMAIIADKKTGFKQKIKEYNTAYVTYGAAYSANIASIAPDTTETPEMTGTLVSDFITEDDATEIANQIYDWLNANAKEDSSDGGESDVDGDTKETGVEKSADEDGDEIPDSEADSDRRLEPVPDGEASDVRATEGCSDSEADSSETGGEGRVLRPDFTGGLQADGMAEAPNHARCDEQSDSTAPADPHQEEDIQSENSSNGSGPCGETVYDDGVQVSEGAGMISDGPQEDHHETAQSELAAGDDTPDIPTPPTEGKIPNFPIPPKMTGMPVVDKEAAQSEEPGGKIIN